MRRRRTVSRVSSLLLWCVTAGCGPRLDVEEQSDGLTDGQTGHASMSVTGDETTGRLPPTTTTTTTASTTDDAETSDTGEPPPVCEHELGGAFECDPWIQDCPEGEKCGPWNNDGSNTPAGTRCLPVARDPAGVGEPCTAETLWIDDCEVGARCSSLMGWPGPDHICIALCAGCSDAPVCPEGSVCVSSTAGVPLALNLCIPECNPLEDACPSGSNCHYKPDYGCEFLCGPPVPSPIADGEPCTYVNDCEPGSGCVEAEVFGLACEGEQCCTPFCDSSDPAGDNACEALTPGLSCVSLCDRHAHAIGVCGVADP
jgi:hypothetical protein